MAINNIDESEFIDIKTSDICPRGRHPEDILSNLCCNEFCYDDVQCGCIEAFLQSLKYQDEKQQREICLMSGKEARMQSISDWQKDQIVWWKGRAIHRQSSEYKRLVREAFSAMYAWSARFRDVLMSSVGKELRYNSGRQDPHKMILTDQEFCKILTDLRRSKKLEYKLVKYPRLWPNSYGVEEDYI